MKVMCIEEFKINIDGNEPKVGEIVTIFLEETYMGIEWVKLEEYQFADKGRGQWFAKKHFTPLSDIDEMELVNERELVNS